MNPFKSHSKALQSITVFLVCFGAFSCAPKKSGVRADVKTASTTLNPGTAAIAEQQAQAQNAMYKISSISLPHQSDIGATVDSELLNPSNQYLPVTTAHENGQMDSQGIFNDTQRGLQVHVQARCTDSVCTKYILLVTVVRNNQALFQSAAISFKDDCSFYTSSVSSGTGQMYQSLDGFASAYSSVQPRNDGDSCLQ